MREILNSIFYIAKSRKVRKAAKRSPDTSVGILDAQAIKTTAYDSIKGFDNWKKINGLKLFMTCDIVLHGFL